MREQPTVRLHTRRPLLKRRSTWVVLGTVVVVLLAVALPIFQPWKLFVNQTVEEGLPETSAGTSAAEPVVLASGRFITHEHDTTGTVQVLRLPDGSRVVRLEDLRTSNGPALKVWITDAPVIEGLDGWNVFDDGRYVDLGDLKGNIGSSNYPLPDDVDISQLNSVSIWCDRFNVSFGAAELTPAS
ncbi:MAG: DM13 domain-containing protein [Pseudonocardia sp.]